LRRKKSEAASHDRGLLGLNSERPDRPERLETDDQEDANNRTPLSDDVQHLLDKPSTEDEIREILSADQIRPMLTLVQPGAFRSFEAAPRSATTGIVNPRFEKIGPSPFRVVIPRTRRVTNSSEASAKKPEQSSSSLLPSSQESEVSSEDEAMKLLSLMSDSSLSTPSTIQPHPTNSKDDSRQGNFFLRNEFCFPT